MLVGGLDGEKLLAVLARGVVHHRPGAGWGERFRLRGRGFHGGRLGIIAARGFIPAASIGIGGSGEAAEQNGETQGRR